MKERVQAQTSRFHGVRLNKRTKKWEVRTVCCSQQFCMRLHQMA